jgi:L-2,4-diaminobutyrate decarboxylase
MAREFSEIAAEALLTTGGPVRQPRSLQLARRLTRASQAELSPAELLRQIQRASLKLSHPRFAAQQVAAPIPAAALVESVVAAMNNSLAVWEMSPIATAIDREVLGRFKRLFGYPAGAEGSFVPGGAFANLTALLAARDALVLGGSRKGGARVAFLCGEQAHYSVSRSAGILGMGSGSVFKVPYDQAFSTDITRVDETFRAARKAGFRKFILVASSGSTPTGSFDDLPALHNLARTHGAWLHVDAAHGAGHIFNRRLRSRLEGLELADSLTFDPHKMMFMPLAAGGVLVRDGECLAKSLRESAPYLFGSTRELPDIGQFTIACSQRFDALKIWLVSRLYGWNVWDALVSHVCEVAQAAYEYCDASSLLAPVHRPQSNIFCFRVREASARQSDSLHTALKEELNESGFAYISSTVLAGTRVLRLVIMNPRTTAADVHALLAEIERLLRKRRTARRKAV